MAAILLLAAQSDGSVSPTESAELQKLITDRFANSDDQTIQAAADASQRIPDLSNTSELIEAANQGLPSRQKEDLMVMVLQIIAADERKEPGELALLDKLVDGLGMPGNTVDRVYSRYFKDRKNS